MIRKFHRNDAVDFLSVVMKPQHYRAHMRNHAPGFTLIELIACIVIIGILAAVVGPSMFSNTSFSGRGYTDEVAAAIRYANSVAVASGCDTAVTLTAIDYKVWQHPAAGNTCATTGAWSTPVLRIDDTTQVMGSAPSNITLSPVTQLVFNSQGKLTSGALALTIKAPPALNAGTHTISIDAISGMVTVQ